MTGTRAAGRDREKNGALHRADRYCGDREEARPEDPQGLCYQAFKGMIQILEEEEEEEEKKE